MHVPDGNFLPAAYMLLPGKSEEIYQQAFAVLKRAVNGKTAHVTKFSCDFERAVHNTISDIFEDAEIDGCNFHWKQCNRRNAVQLGCSDLLNRCAEFRQLFDFMNCLAFVPPGDVLRIYEGELKPLFKKYSEVWSSNETGDGYEKEANEYLMYFERNWIGAEGRHGNRRKPKYDVKLWNKHEQIVDADFVLTNNGNEVFNSTWAPSIPKSATVWTVIEEFKRQESLAREAHNELLRGLHQAHNSSRDKGVKARMHQLHSIVVNYEKFEKKTDFFNVIVSL